MDMIFDIGMYDGADTQYYLNRGYKVVAVDANPELVAQARESFAQELSLGRLVVVHAAISQNGEDVELELCRENLGSSTIVAHRFREKNRTSSGSVVVPGTTLGQLFKKYGLPKYVKVDIEGADELCVFDLSAHERPDYFSFELVNHPKSSLQHLASIGFKEFRLVNQVSFLELRDETSLRHRLGSRLHKALGKTMPKTVVRDGYEFVRGHSSGPVPWLSRGRWASIEDTLELFDKCRAEDRLHSWYDAHARV